MADVADVADVDVAADVVVVGAVVLVPEPVTGAGAAPASSTVSMM